MNPVHFDKFNWMFMDIQSFYYMFVEVILFFFFLICIVFFFTVNAIAENIILFIKFAHVLGVILFNVNDNYFIRLFLT